MNKTVNPEMLTLAREIRGVTQKQVSESSGVRQGKISRYEGGLAPVSDSDLSRLAQALEFPTEFFNQKGFRLGNEPNEIFHRRRRKVAIKDLKRIDGLVDLYRLGSRHLLEAFELKSKVSVPLLSIDDFESVADIAATVRAGWRIPSGPVFDLIAWLEHASCLVFMHDFKTDKIDEAVQWIPPSPPIIVVNRSAPADRVRFSLAHALGHLVMHRDLVPYKEMEEEADEFAAAFLMPKNDIHDELTPVTIQHMLELKEYWRVSMQTLIRRAHSLGVISPRRYTSLFQQLSRSGYRKQEPLPIRREIPRLVKTLLDSHKSQLNFSDEDLAKLLRIQVDDYYEWYYPKKIIDFPTSDVVHAKHGEAIYRTDDDSGTVMIMQ